MFRLWKCVTRKSLEYSAVSPKKWQNCLLFFVPTKCLLSFHIGKRMPPRSFSIFSFEHEFDVVNAGCLVGFTQVPQFQLSVSYDERAPIWEKHVSQLNYHFCPFAWRKLISLFGCFASLQTKMALCWIYQRQSPCHIRVLSLQSEMQSKSAVDLWAIVSFNDILCHTIWVRARIYANVKVIDTVNLWNVALRAEFSHEFIRDRNEDRSFHLVEKGTVSAQSIEKWFMHFRIHREWESKLNYPMKNSFRKTYQLTENTRMKVISKKI